MKFMWFRRKSKNRRLDRRTALLDVKLRSSKLRAQRMRWGAIALGVSFGTIFGLYLLWRTGELALNRFIYENQEFAIQKIDVQTDGQISTDQLRRWAGVKLGENLFALSLSRVKRDLELVPAIRSVAVERLLPRTLRISVSEREPVAQAYVSQLRADGRGYDMQVLQIDTEGCVMLPLTARQRSTPPNQPAMPLPTLGGVDQTTLLPGRRLDSPQVRAALDLIVAFERSPMAGLADLRRVDLSSASVITVQTGQGGTIIFAPTDIERQLQRWRVIFDGKAQDHQVIAWLDLSVTHNTPLRTLDANAVAPFTPAPAKKKNSTLRKRNV